MTFAIVRARDMLHLVKDLGLFFDGRDETVALQAAFNKASALSLPLVAPTSGVVAYSTDLTFSGVLHGNGSKWNALSPSDSTIICSGPVRLSNMLMESVNTTERLFSAQCVRLFQAVNFLLQNVHVKRSGSAGISARESTDGQILDCSATETFADGLNIAGACKRIDIKRWKAFLTGDDGGAVVSYDYDLDVCEDIHWEDCESTGGHARGFALVGARNCTMVRNRTKGHRVSGTYFASEGNYNTYGVENCHAIDCISENDVQGDLTSGAFHMAGQSGSRPLPGGSNMSNKVRNCSFIRPVVNGGGANQQAGVSIRANTENCLSDGAKITSVPNSALFNNGQNNTFKNTNARMIGGALMTTDTSMSGSMTEENNNVAGVARSAATKRVRNIAPAAGATSYTILGSVIDTIGETVSTISNGLDAGICTFTGVVKNGVVQ